jgi:hypothetical protein
VRTVLSSRPYVSISMVSSYTAEIVSRTVLHVPMLKPTAVCATAVWAMAAGALQEADPRSPTLLHTSDLTVAGQLSCYKYSVS